LNSLFYSHIRSHYSRARDHQHRASSPGRIANNSKRFFRRAPSRFASIHKLHTNRTGSRFAQYLQGENALSRFTQSSLFAAAVFVLCGAARSAAVAQAPSSHSQFSSYTITTNVARATVTKRTHNLQIAFSAEPSRADEFERGDRSTRVAPMRVVTRITTRRVRVTPDPVIDFTQALAPGKRIVARGSDGLRVVTERVTMWDDVAVQRAVVSSITIRDARPAHIMEGAPRTFSQLAANTPYHKLLHVYAMEATAYTALTAKANPTGYTANGMRAQYGIVAVDPGIIPLGSHVFIPGYGLAIAADTGGAIIGHRIDLCMDQYGQAVRWGRQPVTVYVVDR
jgi:3D (Asp-Asp-Asp) domain-containing protein